MILLDTHVLVWLDQARQEAGFMTRSTLENVYQSALGAAPLIAQAQAGALALFAIPGLALIAAIMLASRRGWWEWPLLLAAIGACAGESVTRSDQAYVRAWSRDSKPSGTSAEKLTSTS